MKIEIYDTTLREGAQGAGVVFSDYERERIIAELDALGVGFIEVGFYRPGSAEALLSLPARVPTAVSRLSLLCPTRRPGTTAAEDPVLGEICASSYPAVAVVGKASLSHVTNILGTTPEENLNMIRDTVRVLKAAGKLVLFDAEHFFDAYAESPDYALRSLRAALDAGADRVVLCDTNGGCLPAVISGVVARVCAEFPGAAVGIHCHNDIGMADACSVSAVMSGACHVQCTVSGVGERCGNANLSTVIPVLQLKLGHACIPADRLSSLAPVTRRICQTANIGFDECDPFVGGHAFMHKAGLHIDAVKKRPDSFEHIDPALVGNSRSLVVSELSGRAAMADAMRRFGLDYAKDAPEIPRVLEALRAAEAQGYQYENSEASLLLLICRTLGLCEAPFVLSDYKLIFQGEGNPDTRWSAIVKFRAEGSRLDGEELRVAEGDGPVNAVDLACHGALHHVFPCMDDLKMVDIKARIDSNDRAASASIVRVYVESGDGERVWRTMGASTDIIAASLQALLDSYEYYILLRTGKLPALNK